MFQVLTLSTTCQGFKTLTLPSTPRKRWRFSNSNFQSHPHKKSNISLKINFLHLQKKHHNLQPRQNTVNLNQIPTPPKKHRELTPTSNFTFCFKSLRSLFSSRLMCCAADGPQLGIGGFAATETKRGARTPFSRRWCDRLVGATKCWSR